MNVLSFVGPKMFSSFITGEQAPPLREQVRAWTRDIKKQMRTLDRDIEGEFLLQVFQWT